MLPPRSSPQVGRLRTAPLTATSMPALDILPTLKFWLAGKPSEGTCRTVKRASVVNRWYQVNSKVNRLRNNAASKPSSASRVRSGPTSGLPMVPGRKQDSLFEVHANQVLRASNAPGARPDQPREPRSFISPRACGQKGSSEMTYDPLILG